MQLPFSNNSHFRYVRVHINNMKIIAVYSSSPGNRLASLGTMCSLYCICRVFQNVGNFNSNNSTQKVKDIELLT